MSLTGSLKKVSALTDCVWHEFFLALAHLPGICEYNGLNVNIIWDFPSAVVTCIFNHLDVTLSVLTVKVFPKPLFMQFWNTLLFSVFMRRSCIPKLKTTFPSEVLVVSDKRSYGNLTFGNVLARLGSSFCYRACLNFQAFSLHDMKWWQEKVVA